MLQRNKSYASILLLSVSLFAFVQINLLFLRTPVLSVSAVEVSNNVQIYSDPTCEKVVYQVDWGNLLAGATQYYDFYVRNEGNNSVVLKLMTQNWLPLDAQQNMMLSWDYTGYPIYTNQVEHIQLELAVSPKIKDVTSFSFNILIECKECNLSLSEVANEQILNAPANTVYFIYNNPSLQNQAEATYDGTSGEILRNLCTNTQNYGFSTQQNWLLPSGAINTTTINNSTIALFGGRLANVVVNYYETVKNLLPITFTVNGDYLCFENRTGAPICDFPLSVIASSGYSEDMFIAMVFYDVEGDNTFLVMYGVGWKGTWASGIYFKEVMSQNLDAYTDCYYMFHWVDTNEDGIPQSSEIQSIGGN
ncbi:MAG: hypothetical protein NWF06_10065 [Candidatus Bathyarchaeota archaeon]|nr:hypothetical protein [Candidatus Bathyarchaeum sp.]